MNNVQRAKCRAFSMIEVALALGIVGFSLLAIMGLFPLALNTARDSLTETRATQLAQDSLSDLVGQHGLRIGNNWNSTVFPNSGKNSVTVGYDSEGVYTSDSTRIFYNQRVTLTQLPLPTGVCTTNWQAEIYTAWPNLTNPTGSNRYVRVICLP